DVTAVGDAADLQGAPQIGANEVIGKDGRERGDQGSAHQPQHADKSFLPAARFEFAAAVHVGASGNQADGPVKGIYQGVFFQSQMKNQHAHEDHRQQNPGADFDRQIDLDQRAPGDAAEPADEPGPEKLWQ